MNGIGADEKYLSGIQLRSLLEAHDNHITTKKRPGLVGDLMYFLCAQVPGQMQYHICLVAGEEETCKGIRAARAFGLL